MKDARLLLSSKSLISNQQFSIQLKSTRSWYCQAWFRLIISCYNVFLFTLSKQASLVSLFQIEMMSFSSLIFFFIFRALWFIFTFANSLYIVLPLTFPIQFIDCFLNRKCALFFSLLFYFIFRALWFIFTFANSSYIALLLTFLIQFIDCFLHRKCGLHIPHPLFSCNSLKQVWSFPCTQSCTLLHLQREKERE